jgi:predicted component of type VI protein secretion system
MRTYHSHDVKLDFLDDGRTQLKNAQDELVAAQSYIHHLKTELHERDEHLELSQAQAAKLQDAVEHMQELISQEPEDPEEVEGLFGVEDN